MSSVSDKVRVLNNAGAALLEAGYVDMARDLFQEAIRLFKVVNEREIADLSAASAKVEPGFSRKAIDHLRHLEWCIRNPRDSVSGYMDDDMEGEYRPYIYRRPFLILNESWHICESHFDSDRRARFNCSVLLFNKAISDHIQNRSSHTALGLYKLVLSLLHQSSPNDLNIEERTMKVAAFNNISVWCFENSEIVGAAESIARLQSSLQSESPHLLNDERCGLLSNLLWLLAPLAFTSPAA